MSDSRKHSLKMFGILLFAWLFINGVGFSLGALVVMPLLRWAMHGVLYFPTSGPELVRLAGAVTGVSAVAAIAMWLEGKWRGRW